MVRQFAAVIDTYNGRELRQAAFGEPGPETFYRNYCKNNLLNPMILFRSKYFLKFTNIMLAKTTPFLFYLVGGILVIKGDFTISSSSNNKRPLSVLKSSKVKLSYSFGQVCGLAKM